MEASQPAAGGRGSPADRWIDTIEVGRCACAGCPGELAPAAADHQGSARARCRICTCAHWVEVIYGNRYACWIPDWSGRCTHVELRRRAELSERRRQEFSRRLTEESAGADRH